MQTKKIPFPKALCVCYSFCCLLSFANLAFFSFFFTAEGSYNKTIVFLFGSVSMPLFFFFSIPDPMACFCAAFVCIVFLFGNYVKDEPPKENTLWMVQRDAGINRNVAKMKFKQRP